MRNKTTKVGRVQRGAIILAALALGLAAGFQACKNPLAVSAKLIKEVAASPLTAVAIKDGPALANGGAFDFGEVSIASAKDSTFTIRNEGKSELKIDLASLAVTGTDSSLFSFVTKPPASLSPQASAEFSIRFAPGAMGAKSATASFSGNDVSNATFSIALAGTGTDSAPLPVIEGGNQQCIPDGLTTVSISSPNANATIYYTKDGSLPTLAGSSTKKYEGAFAFDFSDSGTIRCYSTVPGMKDSAVVTAYFTTTSPVKPEFSLSGGIFYSADALPVFVISSPTTNAKIVFTIDGSAPDPSASSPITVKTGDDASATTATYVMPNGASFRNTVHSGGHFTLQARAYVSSGSTYFTSDIVTATYSFKLSTPSFSGIQPQTSYFASGQVVKLGFTDGATVHYVASTTTVPDPSIPSQAVGVVYTAAGIAANAGTLGVAQITKISAMAYETNWQDSDILTGSFPVCAPGVWDTSTWDQATWQ